MNADDEVRLVPNLRREYTPITQWYRYRPISHIPISELEVTVKFGIGGTLLVNTLVFIAGLFANISYKNKIQTKHESESDSNSHYQLLNSAHPQWSTSRASACPAQSTISETETESFYDAAGIPATVPPVERRGPCGS